MTEPRSACFDDFQAGQVLPVYEYLLTDELVAEYARVTGADPAVYREALHVKDGATLAPPLLLDTLHALKSVLAFPEGVVHAREEVAFRAPARAGERVVVRLTVLDKYLKNERRFLVFEQRAENARGQELVTARKTFVWPC